jgi:ribose 5-phosphate isomerase A
MVICRGIAMQTASKKAAAKRAVQDTLQNNMAIGIGSGSTVVHVVEEIARIVQINNWSLTLVPSSFQASQLLLQHKLPIGNLWQHFELDLTYDGADAFDDNGNLIKGGGGCHTQEKILAFCSKTLVIVADYSKRSSQLGQTVHSLTIFRQFACR